MAGSLSLSLFSLSAYIFVFCIIKWNVRLCCIFLHCFNPPPLLKIITCFIISLRVGLKKKKAIAHAYYTFSSTIRTNKKTFPSFCLSASLTVSFCLSVSLYFVFFLSLCLSVSLIFSLDHVLVFSLSVIELESRPQGQTRLTGPQANRKVPPYWRDHSR